MSIKISTFRPKNFSERLINLRLGGNLTLQRLAELTKIPRSTLSEIENNKYNPSSLVLVRLSDFFNVNSTWLLTGEGDMHKNPEGNPPEEPRPGPPGVNEAQPEYADRDEPTTEIPADYPLAKKLNAEIEDAARLGLTEEELTDLLLHILEGELIKQRRRPRPATELVPEPPVVEPAPQSLPYPALLALIRRIVKEEIPPEGEPERRKCMLDIVKVLRESDNIKGDISPETP